MGDSSPGLGVTPSIVVITEPSACGTNIRQERTATPSASTVQAPQTPCSQPACAPLRPSTSRRQSSSVVRGSTSTSCSRPLTCSLVCMDGPILRDGFGIGDCADGKHERGMTAIVGGGMQVLQRLDVGKRAAKRLVDTHLLQRTADEQGFGGLELQRHVRGAADTNGNLIADAVVLQGELHGGGHECEIAGSRIDLMERRP